MTKKTWIRLAFALSLTVTAFSLVPETEAVLKCPRTYCFSLTCASPCVRTLGPCTACSGGNGTPARYFRCVDPGTGAQCGTAQYCLDPACLG